MVSMEFKDKTKYVLLLTLFTTVFVTTFVIAPEVFLLIFAGSLVSVLLVSLRDLTIKYLPLSKGLALTFVILLLTLVSVAVVVAVAPSVARQFDELVKEIPKTFASLQKQIESYTWGRYLLDHVNAGMIVGGNGGTASGFGGALTGLFGVLGFFGNLVVILFIGLYGAADPELYQGGFLKLIPISKRKRAKVVLEETFDTLKWWLIGQFFSMSVIGVSTMIGLYFLDVPLAFILGLIAAVLTFVPNIGPVLAAVPAILLSLTNDPKIALYVALLYLGTQILESYFLTPLVQQKTIDLPPALILAVQVLFGITLGIMGLALAAPLTGVLILLTKMLYVEDYLGDSTT